MPLVDDQRYSRQIQLPQISALGQEKLARSSILIAGAGGLGSLSSLYLAAAGVGHLIIVDHDQVEPSNLNRQLLHKESSIGQPKALSAADSLGRLNSSIKITPIQAKLDLGNIDDLLKGV
ncbi:MAG: ThiF family adenylyltransferase, partial [Desulfobacula sp.]|nr:ThiF family adenylyltransferase [Desulfobacula sp.]